jgi:hypothetical protein
MPGLNKTGPAGQGPQTGRKMGNCNPENERQVDETGRGRGFGRGPGRKMRLGNGWNSPGDGNSFGRGNGRGKR